MRITRRTQMLAATFVAALFLLAAVGGPSPLPAPATASAASCPGSDSSPRQISSEQASKMVVCLINRERAKHGLHKVHVRGELDGAAEYHSANMQATDCFDHTCPGEPALTGRYEKSDYLPCGCSWGAAENIAWGPRGKGSPRSIVDAWMGSAEHRANILSGSYTDVGVGVRWGSPDKPSESAGTYTLDFGYRK